MSLPADAADPAAAVAVLMAVRVKGRAAIAALVDASGVDAAAVRAVLAAAGARGAVRALEGDRYAITAAGKAEAVTLAAAAVDRSCLAAGYDEFLAHDRAIKQAITAWQEARAGARLGVVRATAIMAVPVLTRLAAVVPRYAAYGRRLARVLERIAAGDAAAVAHPRGDSLHQLWFELHEDLLVTLGRARVS